MRSFAIGALLGFLAALVSLASGRLHRDHRGFSPPPADAPLDVPLWLVVLLFAGMGVSAPLVAIWRAH